jgi:hypothetical protein
VVDLLGKARVPARVLPVTITVGQAVRVAEDGSRRVPKQEWSAACREYCTHAA